MSERASREAKGLIHTNLRSRSTRRLPTVAREASEGGLSLSILSFGRQAISSFISTTCTPVEAGQFPPPPLPRDPSQRCVAPARSAEVTRSTRSLTHPGCHRDQCPADQDGVDDTRHDGELRCGTERSVRTTRLAMAIRCLRSTGGLARTGYSADGARLARRRFDHRYDCPPRGSRRGERRRVAWLARTAAPLTRCIKRAVDERCFLRTCAHSAALRLFVRSRTRLQRRFQVLARSLHPAGVHRNGRRIRHGQRSACPHS